jgi:hypothetical protein
MQAMHPVVSGFSCCGLSWVSSLVRNAEGFVVDVVVVCVVLVLSQSNRRFKVSRNRMLGLCDLVV